MTLTPIPNGGFETPGVAIGDADLWITAVSASLELYVGFGVAAIGLIVAVPGSELNDGENFVLDDNVTVFPIVFEFDDDDSVSESFILRQVVFDGNSTASEVRDAIVTAITDHPSIFIKAFPIGQDSILLVNDALGVDGNIPIITTVVALGFSVAGMSGGGEVSFDGFETGWDNDAFLFGFNEVTALGLVSALFDNNLPPPEQFEDFERGWAQEPPPRIPAIGTIRTTTGAALNDGEIFTIGDGFNPAVVFEFDDDDSVVETLILRQVVITGSETANDIRNLMVLVINAAPVLFVTAEPDQVFTSILDLESDTPGIEGNVPITDTVLDGTFSVSGMSGGTETPRPGNETFSFDLVSTDTALFNTGLFQEPFDSFEAQWLSNEVWRNFFSDLLVTVVVAEEGDYRIRVFGVDFIHPAADGESAISIRANLRFLINDSGLLVTATDVSGPGGFPAISLVPDNLADDMGVEIEAPTPGDMTIGVEEFAPGVLVVALFDITFSRSDFERGWSDNENFLFQIESGPTGLAVFDVAENEFEDFEEEWPNEVMTTIT